MPRRSSKDKNGSPATQPGVLAVVRFTAETVHRSKIKAAPYNPRKITDKAMKKLRENIDRVGLIDPPVWNATTGNLVGGHQRLRILDAIAGTTDYLVPVSRVEMDEQTEKEQNVFLNNPDAQGSWDLDKFEPLLTEHKIDLDRAGLDRGEVIQVFGHSVLEGRPNEMESLAESMKQFKEFYKQIKEQNREKASLDFYLVAVFASHKERKAFTDGIGAHDNRYIDGRDLQKLVTDGKADETQEKAG